VGGSEDFTGAESHTVTFQANVSVYEVPVNYHFEYGTTTAYGSSTPTLNTGSSVAESAAVSAHLEDLAPNVEYHFRVVAESGGVNEDGPDVSFVTLPVASTGLPDNRVYEMVTPPQNANSDVFIPGTLNVDQYDGVGSTHPF
jgi:hypothetical protein